MHLGRVDLKTVSIALPRTVSNSQRAWTHRQALILRLSDPHGVVAFGEAAPLPGYSLDDLATCGRALEAVDWASLPEPDPDAPVRPQLAAWSAGLDPRAPAALCALESALLDLLARRAQVPLWRLLSGTEVGPLAISALLADSSLEESVRAAERALARGITTLKLKVARPGRFEEERTTLATVRRASGTATALRLDANGGFDSRDAAERLLALAECAPEFIEEPVRTEALPALEAPAVPIAFDESLQRDEPWTSLERTIAQGHCAAVVLKPMALGVGRCLDLAEQARARGLDVTVSHLHDGPIGFAVAVQVALAVASRRYASGLERHTALDAWPAAAVSGLGPSRIEPTDAPGLGLHFSGEP